MTTTTEPAWTVELDEATARIVARLVELQSATAAIEAEAKELKKRLRAAATVGQSAVFRGQAMYSLQSNRRFDLDTALTLLTPAQAAACTVTTVDAKLVREQLPPVLVEQCMVDQGDAKVVLAR